MRIVVLAASASLLTACGPDPCEGGEVTNADQVAAVGECTTVTGDLTVRYMQSEVVLPSVERVDGTLAYYGAGAPRIAMPALRSVGGHATFELYGETELDLGALQTVEGALAVDGGALAVDLPELTAAGGLHVFGQYGDAPGLSVPKLTTVASPADDFRITLDMVDGQNFEVGPGILVFDQSYAEVSLPELTEVAWLDVERLPNLVAFDAPKLTTVGTALYLVDDPLLATWSLPALEGVDGIVTVLGNDALHTIETPALARVGGNIEVRGNPSLPQCAVQAWVDALALSGGFTGTATIEDNDLDASCE